MSQHNHIATHAVLRADQTRLKPGKTVAIGPAAAKSHQITVNRNGESVESIEVTCSCGEKIVIKCQYE